jgi:hypothetical protein
MQNSHAMNQEARWNALRFGHITKAPGREFSPGCASEEKNRAAFRCGSAQFEHRLGQCGFVDWLGAWIAGLAGPRLQRKPLRNVLHSEIAS